MLHDSNVTEYSLASGTLMSIHLHAGLLITADAGTLWITEPGEGDIVLLPGEHYRSESHGKLVIEAMTAARLHFSRLDTAAAPRLPVYRAPQHSVGKQLSSSHSHGEAGLCGSH